MMNTARNQPQTGTENHEAQRSSAALPAHGVMPMIAAYGVVPIPAHGVVPITAHGFVLITQFLPAVHGNHQLMNPFLATVAPAGVLVVAPPHRAQYNPFLVPTNRTVSHNMAKLRSGKWITEEDEYAVLLIELFEKGIVSDCEDGATLRSYLAQKLRCAPMRISKKFAGKRIGKKMYVCKRITVPPELVQKLKTTEDKYQKAIVQSIRSFLPASLSFAASPAYPAVATPGLPVPSTAATMSMIPSSSPVTPPGAPVVGFVALPQHQSAVAPVSTTPLIYGHQTQQLQDSYNMQNVQVQPQAIAGPFASTINVTPRAQMDSPTVQQAELFLAVNEARDVVAPPPIVATTTRPPSQSDQASSTTKELLITGPDIIMLKHGVSAKLLAASRHSTPSTSFDDFHRLLGADLHDSPKQHDTLFMAESYAMMTSPTTQEEAESTNQAYRAAIASQGRTTEDAVVEGVLNMVMDQTYLPHHRMMVSSSPRDVIVAVSEESFSSSSTESHNSSSEDDGDARPRKKTKLSAV